MSGPGVSIGRFDSVRPLSSVSQIT